MTNGKMDAIEVQDTVVGQKWAYAPRFKLFSQRLVQTADRAGDFRPPLSVFPRLSQLYEYLYRLQTSLSSLQLPLVHSDCSARRPACETPLLGRLRTFRFSIRPVEVTKSRVEKPFRYPRRLGVDSPHDAPIHCSSSSTMTCSIKTWTALTSRDNVNADEIPPDPVAPETTAPALNSPGPMW